MVSDKRMETTLLESVRIIKRWLNLVSDPGRPSYTGIGIVEGNLIFRSR